MLNLPAESPNSAIAMPERPAVSLRAEDGNSETSGTPAASEDGAAHAVYAPQPEIPEELRQEALRTEAIAVFTVSPDGEVIVTLTKATGSPELNNALLETLKLWRFLPAVKDGVAVTSTVEVRIPIAVQ